MPYTQDGKFYKALVYMALILVYALVLFQCIAHHLIGSGKF